MHRASALFVVVFFLTISAAAFYILHDLTVKKIAHLEHQKKVLEERMR